MRKKDEVASLQSCLNRAADDEWVFVLLERDVAAPAAIRAWARERIRRGKNLVGDAQITEALAAAQAMAGYPCHQKGREHWCDSEGPGGFMGHTCVAPTSVVPPGFLEVGITDGTHEVIVNHGDLDVDVNGCGHIVFSPAQARNLAVLLITKAHEAEQS